MTLDEVRTVLDDLRKRYVPDESKKQGMGQLGFDYGYQQALAEVESRLWVLEAVTAVQASGEEANLASPGALTAAAASKSEAESRVAG